ncbi:NUDIX hydrolase [Pseudogracilibacillus sp. SO30301A]|uniref:NUDIX hydrolase n=1 Tax=Pseudogracilibacillus sp. SO30301A TaxID=3098291 RepID=UPI00300DD8AE
MKKFEEKTLRSEKLFDGNIISLQVDDVELPDGNTSKREIVKHPGAVAVIAITPQNKILLVEQYRKPLERSLLEIPAGKIELDEDPKITAIRELEEETGYRAEALQYITSFYTSPGFANEIIHIYYSNALQKAENPISGDEDEFIEIHELSIAEAEALMQTKDIYDAKTVYALTYLKLMGLNKHVK